MTAKTSGISWKINILTPLVFKQIVKACGDLFFPREKKPLGGKINIKTTSLLSNYSVLK